MQVELILLVLSLLFFASIFTDKIGYKFGVPALLLFLAVGMLFGSDGIGRLINDDGVGYMLNVGSAQAIGTIALCIILFSGGLDTKLSDIRPVMMPGLTLATIGVLITMLVTGVITYYVFGWLHSVASVSIAVAMLMASTKAQPSSVVGVGVGCQRPDGICADYHDDRYRHCYQQSSDCLIRNTRCRYSVDYGCGTWFYLW